MNEILAWQERGVGDPVLLLNGGMMSGLSWEPIAGRLAERYRVVTCDFRGQLLSPGRAHRDLDGNVDDLLALLDALELGSVHLLGTSFGAEVGLLAAARQPRRARSLIAVTATDHASATIHRGVEDLRRLVEEILAGADAGRLHDRLVEEVYSPAFVESRRQELDARREQMAALPEAWYRGLEGILAATESFDLRPRLGEIRCPTLVVVAAGDRVMPPERSRALAAAVRGAEVVEHPQSGHALVAEDPEWLVEVCLEFLERQR